MTRKYSFSYLSCCQKDLKKLSAPPSSWLTTNKYLVNKWLVKKSFAVVSLSSLVVRKLREKVVVNV
jgi:hypothetical protein